MSPGQFYHVFNKANGSDVLFLEEMNYHFSLNKLAKYILPVCKIYSYCLVENEFDLFVQIRTKIELQQLWSKPKNIFPLSDKILCVKTSKAFSNFFSSYAQAYNKVYSRQGSLFIPSMKVEPVDDNISFRKLVCEMHLKPVVNNYANALNGWPFSSYRCFFENDETIVEKNYVFQIFGGMPKFLEYHDVRMALKNKKVKTLSEADILYQ